MNPPAHIHIPGYHIQGEIGQGAMATVYLAVQQALDRQVALKVMSPALNADPAFYKRFQKEGRIIARLSHPNIVTVHDIGTYESLNYMALEYAGAGNLSRRIEAGLPPRQVVEILIPVAHALGYAHARGFVHRDVKPENILFREGEIPLLSDFGIAKALDSATQMTKLGSAVGTPRYMSPEQAMGKPATTRSDLYSLGVLLFEMLTGRRPYDSESSFATALMHVNEPIPRLPQGLERFQPVIDRLMAKRPEDRYADADELIQALHDVENLSLSAFPALSGQAGVTPSGEWRTPIPTPAPTPTGGRTPEGRTPEGRTPEGRTPEGRTPEGRTRRGWPALLLVLLTAAGLGTGAWLYLTPRDTEGPAAVAPEIIRDLRDYAHLRLEQLAGVSQAYQRLLRLDADNAEARGGMRELADQYISLARWSWVNVDRALGLEVIREGLEVLPNDPELLALKQQIETVQPDGDLSLADRRRIEGWLVEAEGHMAAGRFILPLDNNAVESYRKVLSLDPTNTIARQRLNSLASAFEERARRALDDGERERALLLVRQGLLIEPTHQALRQLEGQLEGAEKS